MLRVQAEALVSMGVFFRDASTILPITGGLIIGSGNAATTKLPKEYWDELVTDLASLVEHCAVLDLPVSQNLTEEVLAEFRRECPTFGERATEVEHLRRGVESELKSRLFLRVLSSRVPYFDEPRKGWEAVIARFPDTAFDIKESAKCFALERYAASIYHSLQVVEAGLVGLGPYVGVTDPKPSFGATDAKLKALLAKKHADLTDFERSNRPNLEQIHGTIEAMKNAWRNKISHVSEKLLLLPGPYSEEIAEEILVATRAFMRRLATSLPASPSL